MKSTIAVVAAVALLLLGWTTFRHPRPGTASRTDPSPALDAAVAGSLPAPPASAATAAPDLIPLPQPQTTNLMARIIKGDLPDVTLDRLETYLQANHRDAESLLTAYQATGDRALLDEALAKFPGDPRVAYTAWFRAQPDANDPGALKARRQALDVFKQAAPDNALANYLSAANYFKSGQPELALQELQAGAGKAKFDDYTQDAIQSMQEAYQAAGYSEVESKLAATSGALLPHLAELKQAGVSLVDLANSYRQAGDGASAQAALQMGLDLGQRLDDPDSLTLIQTLVGIAIQRKALDAMGAAASDAGTSQAVRNRITALTEQREEIRTMVSGQQLETWLQTAPAGDVSAYLDRHRLFGEQRALRWLVNRNQKQ